jgi:shikimate kinase
MNPATQPPSPARNIALIGFMGAGKTTVGAILAQILGFEFLDTDKVIEQRQGRRIPDIFAKEGEPYFRRLESELCAELESATHKVIATGGGLPVNPANLESLRRHAFVACLWASPETLHARVRTQQHRPLLLAEDPLARIRELLALRTPAYKQAHLILGVDFRSPAETARHIANAFHHGTPGE